MDAQQIDNLFEVKAVKNPRQLERKQELRIAARDFARRIGQLTSDSAERVIAIRKAHEAMLLGITAIELEN